MGPEAAVNAVYANKIASLPKEEQAAFIQEKRKEYAEDIDIYRLASELVVDVVIQPEELRTELVKRFAYYLESYETPSTKKHGVYPV
jgi:methylmalonyl-CoA decarboxylase subunit alpha